MSSYRIHTSGPRQKVIAEVLATKADVDHELQSQIMAERIAIVAEIKALPEKYTGIRVFAFGDQFVDHSSCRREISGFEIPVDSNELRATSTAEKIPKP